MTYDLTTAFLLLIWTASILRFFMLVTSSLPLPWRWRDVVEAANWALNGVGFVGLAVSVLYQLLFN